MNVQVRPSLAVILNNTMRLNCHVHVLSMRAEHYQDSTIDIPWSARWVENSATTSKIPAGYRYVEKVIP